MVRMTMLRPLAVGAALGAIFALAGGYALRRTSDAPPTPAPEEHVARAPVVQPPTNTSALRPAVAAETIPGDSRPVTRRDHHPAPSSSASAPQVHPPQRMPQQAETPDVEPLKQALATRLQQLLSGDPAFRRRLEEAARAQREQDTQAVTQPEDAVAPVAPMLQESLTRFFDQPASSADLKAALQDAVNRPDPKGDRP